LRAPVAEILGIREVVGALRGDFRTVELDRLAQGNLRALAQRWVIAARWKSGSKNANQQRGPERDSLHGNSLRTPELWNLPVEPKSHAERSRAGGIEIRHITDAADDADLPQRADV